MDTITDFSKLDLEDLCCLRTLQKKMRDANGDEDFSKLTVPELRRLIDLHHKMAGEVNPHKPTPFAPAWCDPDCPRCREISSGPPYVPVIPPWYSGVTAPAVALEPVATAQAAAPAKPPAPATPAPAEKPVRPAEDVESGLRQLGSLMRFGIDLPEEPR